MQSVPNSGGVVVSCTLRSRSGVDVDGGDGHLECGGTARVACARSRSDGGVARLGDRVYVKRDDGEVFLAAESNLVV